MVVKFSFSHENKKINLNVLECSSTLSKTTGLIFKKNSPPLLFKFKKPTKTSIHSFFCKPFIAIWFLDNKIIGSKLIKPNQLSIKPKQSFTKLLEIPSNSEFFPKLLHFTDESRNI